jgi:hypothetical protein
MLHILEWIFLRVQEVKGSDGSMANRNGIVEFENEYNMRRNMEFKFWAGRVKSRWLFANAR